MKVGWTRVVRSPTATLSSTAPPVRSTAIGSALKNSATCAAGGAGFVKQDDQVHFGMGNNREKPDQGPARRRLRCLTVPNLTRNLRPARPPFRESNLLHSSALLRSDAEF
jgi:hypothetical protein